METVDKEKAALISGIEADVRAEEEKIIKEAEAQAAEKRKYSEKKIESLLNEAKEKAKEQAQTAKNKIISAAEREVKRSFMHVQDSIVQDIMDRAEKKLRSMTGNEDYRCFGKLDYRSSHWFGCRVRPDQRLERRTGIDR